MITGKWQTHANSPLGEMDPLLVLRCDEDGKLHGECYVPPTSTEPIELKRGKYDGDSFSFRFAKDVKLAGKPIGKMEFSWSGNVDGDNISGKIKALMGSIPFNGNRVEE